MLRRTFFKSISSSLALMLMPRWCHAQLAARSATHTLSITNVAVVVLPASLGAKRIHAVAEAFAKWFASYPAGADGGYGYGDPKPTVLGPNPSLHYKEQLQQLEVAAAAHGGSWKFLSERQRREVVQAALVEAGVTSIPTRPNGKHIATYLLSYFYGSSDGLDFCYNAAIREADCRGLPGSEKRPAPLS